MDESRSCDMDGLKRHLKDCEDAGKLQGLSSARFNGMVAESDGNPVPAITSLVRKDGPTGNFAKMFAAGLGDSTLEGAVYKFSACFNTSTVQEASKRLGKPIPL